MFRLISGNIWSTIPNMQQRFSKLVPRPVNQALKKPVFFNREMIMLTKLIVRNFKRFESVEIELGSPVVFIGPNNSGKTTALQALALWEIGLKRWNEKRKGRQSQDQWSGVTINRRDPMAVPVPSANLLWRDPHVRDVKRANGKQTTKDE
jgi:hypothetical protein